MKDSFDRRPISQITISEIRAWHKSRASTPVSTNRALAILSKIFTFAEEQEIIPLGANPCKRVAHYKERSRRRYATTEELHRIIPLLDKYQSAHPYGVAFLWTLLLTGSRPKALADATWDELDIHTALNGSRYGVLRFHGKSSAKTGDDEVVIIPELALKMIEKLPGRTNNSLLNSKMPSKLWRKIKDEAGCPDLWARDFRRTFATLAMSNGMSLSTIGELLNHRSTQTTKIYAKLMDDTRARAATEIAERIEQLVLA